MFARRMSLFIVLALAMTACFGPFKKRSRHKSDSAPAEVAATPVEATVLSDKDGVVTAAIKPDATAPQLVKASGSSTIAKASLIVPPGSLGVATEITIEAGESLLALPQADAAGLAGNISSSGPAVVISSSEKVEISVPMTVTLPLPAEVHGLLDANLAIIAVQKGANGAYTFTIIPVSGAFSVDSANQTVAFPISNFGVFQTVYSIIPLIAITPIAVTVAPPTVRQTAAASPPAPESPPVTPVAAGPGSFTISAYDLALAKVVPTFHWTAASGALSYSLAIATDAQCSTTVATQTVAGTETSYTFGSVADGRYFTCVTAVGSQGQTAASNQGLAFEVDGAPPVVTTSFERVGALTFSVTAAIADANGISLVWTSPAGGLLSNPNDKTTTVTIPGAGTYSVYLMVTDAAGNTAEAQVTLAAEAASFHLDADHLDGVTYDPNAIKIDHGVASLNPVKTEFGVGEMTPLQTLGAGLVNGGVELQGGLTVANQEIPAPASADAWVDPTDLKFLARMNSDTSLDLVSNTAGVPVTLSASLSVVAGVVGNAVSFAASPQQGMNWPGNTYRPSMDGQFTVAFWFRAGNDWGTVFSCANPGSSEGFLINFDGADIRPHFNAQTGSGEVRAPAGAGDWQHYVVTYDGTATPPAMGVFIDGTVSVRGDMYVPSAFPAVDFTNPSYSWHVGGGDDFDGVLDEIAVYSRVLTDGEIATIYRMQRNADRGYFVGQEIDSTHDTNVWSTISRPRGYPSGKPLANDASPAEMDDYPDTGVDMTGNVLLMHLDETPSPNLDASSDSSGTGQLTTLGGSISTLPMVGGVFGKGLELSSGMEAIQWMPPTGILASDHEWSLSLWVRATGDLQNSVRIMGGSLNQGGYGLDGGVSHVELSASFGNPQGPAISILDGKWHHVVLTNFLPAAPDDDLYPGTFEIWVDGVSGGPQAHITPPDSPSSPARIGGSENGDASDLVLDEVAVWSRKLTVPEIKSLYRRGAERTYVEYRTCATAPCTGAWTTPTEDDFIHVGDVEPLRFMQYRISLERLNSTDATPRVESIAFNPKPLNNSNPVLQSSALAYRKLLTFTEVSEGVGYLFSFNGGTDYQVFDGTAWVPAASDGGNASTGPQISAGLATAPENGNLVVKARLDSSLGASVQAESLTLGFLP